MPETNKVRLGIENFVQHLNGLRGSREMPAAEEQLNTAFEDYYPSCEPSLQVIDHYLREIPDSLPDVYSGEESWTRIWLYLTEPSGPPELKSKLSLSEPGTTTTISPYENLPAAYTTRNVLSNGGAVVPIDIESIDLKTRNLARSPFEAAYIAMVLIVLSGSSGIAYERISNKKISRRKFLKITALMTGSIAASTFVTILFDMLKGERPLSTLDQAAEELTKLVGKNPSEWPGYNQIKINFRNLLMSYGLHIIGQHLQNTHVSGLPPKSLLGTFGGGHVGIANKFNEGPEVLAQNISDNAHRFLEGILELFQNKKVSLRDAQRLVFESSSLFSAPEYITATYPLESLMITDLKTPKMLFIDELIQSINTLKKQNDSEQFVFVLENALKSILFELGFRRIMIEQRIKDLKSESSNDPMLLQDMRQTVAAYSKDQILYTFTQSHTLSPSSTENEFFDFGDATITNALPSTYGENAIWSITGCVNLNGSVYPTMTVEYASSSGQKEVKGVLIGTIFLDY